MQRYRIQYPEPDEAPQIVIASQRGGAAESEFEAGNAFYFDSTNTSARLPAARLFREDEWSLSFWADAREIEPLGENELATILTLQNDDCTVYVGMTSSNEWVRYELFAWDTNTGIMNVVTDWLNPSSGWHRITFSCDSTNGTGVVFVNGAAQKTWDVPAGQNLSGYFTQNVLGRSDFANPAPKGLIVDDICVRAAAVTAEEEVAARYVPPDANDSSVTLCLTFPDGDLAARRAAEGERRVSGRLNAHHLPPTRRHEAGVQSERGACVHRFRLGWLLRVGAQV